MTTAAYERDDIEGSVAEAYAALGRQVGRADPPVAVRSSAIAEDMPDASFAGVQDTYLWICGLDAVLDGIRRCWASFHNPEAVAYREAHGITRGGMSVAVQYMVDARVAGVMFTLNPVSGDRSSIAIDASYGLGVSVVGGEVTPDSFLVSKVTREIVRRQIGAKATEVVADPAAATTVTRDVPEELRAQPSLSDEEIVRLAEIGRRIETHYGRPQDVEWAIDRQLGELFILQSRPETVWSRKPRAQPVAGGAMAMITAAMTGGVGDAEGMSDSPELDTGGREGDPAARRRVAVRRVRARDAAPHDPLPPRREARWPKTPPRLRRQRGCGTASSTSRAPMVGTFYRAPAPGEPPFVEVGSPVERGDAGLHPRGDEADERRRRRRPRRRRGGLPRERRGRRVRRRALPHPPGMIGLVDTTVRDGHQSLWSADALTTAMIAEIAPVMDRVGFHAIDFTSSTHMAMAVRTHAEDPWERIRVVRELMPETPLGFITPGMRFMAWQRAPRRRDAARAALRDPQRHPADLGRGVDERRRDRPAHRAHREGGGRRGGARRPRLQHQPGAHRRLLRARARGRSRRAPTSTC